MVHAVIRGLALALALSGGAAAETSPVGLISPSAPVEVSTVSMSVRSRINEQILPNSARVATDASFEKSAIGTGYTVIPLPAFTYNRNEGAWIGGLTPIFRANAKGHIEDIYAPLYLHNDLIGETFTFNYFGYRSETKQYHAILSYATKIERTVDLSYKDTAAGGGRYIVFAQANSGKSAFNRFFGFGNRVSEQRESNYTMGDSNLKVGGGVNLGRSVSLVATERLRRVTIENGAVASLPQTLKRYPKAPGIDGARIWGQGLTLSYDDRDNQLTPLRGSLVSVAAEWEENFQPGDRLGWAHITGEGRNYQPHADGRAVLVTHAFIDAMPKDVRGIVRRGVPFYERPTLGGETTLRGFGRGRFVGNYAVLFNAEERVSVFRRAIMGNLIEAELAPFVDVGRVGRSWSYPRLFENFQVNPGMGLRVLARPNIAGRLDVAYGRDGSSVFVGLDYPF
ncbi:MAG: BamA/TamA family outer membrane protein [Elusimicrobiota bacterium]